MTNVNFQAEIRCWEKDDDEQTAAIRFFQDISLIPADGDENGVMVVNFALGRFQDVMTILQSTSNVSVDFFSYVSGVTGVIASGIGTGKDFPADMDPTP